MEKAKKQSGRIRSAHRPRDRRRAKRKLALEEWADGRSFPLGMLGQQIAITAGELADSLEEFAQPLKRKRLVSQIGGMSEWLGLYRSHRKVWTACEDLLPEDSFTPERIFQEVVAAHPGLGAVPSSTEEFRRFVRESSRFAEEVKRRIERLHARTLRDQISGRDLEHLAKRGVSIAPELIFLSLVEVPCRMKFGVHPGVLFGMARKGNREAICKLVSIDSRVEFDERILRHVVAIREGSNAGQKKELAKSEAMKPRKVTRRKAKYILGGLLFKFAEDMDAGFRAAEEMGETVGLKLRFPKVLLIAPDIRLLFNAAAIDLGEDEMIDVDLPEDPDTLARELRRTKNFWKDALGGQKLSRSCPGTNHLIP